MTENNLIRVTNTPIYDALMREHNIVPSLSPNSTLRPYKGLSLAKKTVQDPRVPYVVEEPQNPDMVVSPSVGDQILVRPLGWALGMSAKEAGTNLVQGLSQPLVVTKVNEDSTMTAEKPEPEKIQAISDSLMFHGISSEEALENASHFPGYVQSADNPHVFVKAVREVLFTEKVDLASMEFEESGAHGASRDWVWKVCRATMDSHPDYTDFQTSLQDEWDGKYTFTITAIRAREEKAA